MTRYYASADVTEWVQQAAGRLLAFDNVDFGQTIYLSKFYEAIEAINGVDFVNISEFRREGALANTWSRKARLCCAPTRSRLFLLMTRRMSVASKCCLRGATEHAPAADYGGRSPRRESD